ncbi:MAG: cyclase family protein [Acidimicrobiia bacterium]
MGTHSQPNPLPTFDELLARTDAPAGSSWGLWGKRDVFGCLNLLTPERAKAGLACAIDGRVFNLDMELDRPEPPLFGRKAFEHQVLQRPAAADDVVHFNTQSSTQWDGFRHIRHPVHGYYNGLDPTEHGTGHWARKGIVGRAVLVDIERWRAAEGRPIQPGTRDEIQPDEVRAAADRQGVTIEPGDILLLHTGWLRWYRTLDIDGRAATAELPVHSCGLAPGRETARLLWDWHVAAVASDAPALEVFPRASVLDPAKADAMEGHADLLEADFLHLNLLPMFGMPIGELFDLTALADNCATDNRYTCLLTSSPLNVTQGVATPPNALAIK